MARVATAKKSAALVSIPGAKETRPRSQAQKSRPGRAAEPASTDVQSQPVEPVVIQREESTLESEFMEAMQHYKKASGRMFPTWSEVLEVLHSLGYRKPGQEEMTVIADEESS